MAVPEVVAFMRACGRLATRPYKGIRPLEEYGPLVDMGHSRNGGANQVAAKAAPWTGDAQRNNAYS
jgi:hypothetical protein